MPLRRKLLSVTVCQMCLIAMAPGCSDTQRDDKKPTTRTSDAALNDPFGKWSNVDTDISGGNTGELKKESLKNDVDRVLLK